MNIRIALIGFFFCFTTIVHSQDTARINAIENQLEVLKVETPGLQEIININIAQTTLANFLLAIAKVHKININVSPELNDINIVNNFNNVTVSNVFLFVAKEFNLDINFTGNILSIKKHAVAAKENKEKEIVASYVASNKYLSLDLKNDKLDKSFRKIMDVSGKNLLYTPDIESAPLSIYINNVPFDLALEKLAEANNLVLTISEDGFYLFENAFNAVASESNTNVATRKAKKRRVNFNYSVIDTLERRVTVDFQNTPVADVIYTIGEDLGLDIFTASPLDEAGLATVTAENIAFDLLLDKIFESTYNANETQSSKGNTKAVTTIFAYKKDRGIYYFGTENQLSLKQVELVTMMHRSIKQLVNPSGNGERRAGRNDFNNTGSSNYNPINTTQSLRNQNSTSRKVESKTDDRSIEDIIPDDIKDGLDIKIDTELNSFVVSGPGAKVERFKNFITYIDKPVPMILIEVMILEVNRSAVVETGVSFGLGQEPSQTVGGVFPSTDIRLGAASVNKIIGSFNGFGSLNLGNVLPEFFVDIKAMETNGIIKVLSTPKLSTINGHKAYLSSGVTSYYAVTTQNFFGSQVPVNSEITNYVPIDAELALEIQPFVSGDGEITLDVQVIQSTFNGERIAKDAPPGINSRQFSSIIRMRDQDLAILGGIEEVKKDDSGSGVPLLARIPIIKWFFSQKRREDSKRKLNILIKPTVIY